MSLNILNSNTKSSRKAKILPQFSISSENKPLLDLLEIQRKSFFDFLQHGIPHELAKIAVFREIAKNSTCKQELELKFNPETYKFISPNFTPKEAILNGKTYACKVYVQATLMIRSPSDIQKINAAVEREKVKPNLNFYPYDKNKRLNASKLLHNTYTKWNNHSFVYGDSLQIHRGLRALQSSLNESLTLNSLSAAYPVRSSGVQAFRFFTFGLRNNGSRTEKQRNDFYSLPLDTGSLTYNKSSSLYAEGVSCATVNTTPSEFNSFLTPYPQLRFTLRPQRGKGYRRKPFTNSFRYSLGVKSSDAMLLGLRGKEFFRSSMQIEDLQERSSSLLRIPLSSYAPLYPEKVRGNRSSAALVSSEFLRNSSYLRKISQPFTLTGYANLANRRLAYPVRVKGSSCNSNRKNHPSTQNIQIFRPWIFLGELPLMTKRGHFILNGSPRVIVNQIARCPGIYFQEKRRGVGIEQEIRVSADLIPQRGPWLRVQSDWEGRFWARLKQEGRVKYATLYEAFQEFEKEYNPPLICLLSNSSFTNPTSSLFSKSETATFQERKIKEDRQKKALIRLFKNSSRYSLGKLGRFRVNERIHFTFTRPPHKEITSIMSYGNSNKINLNWESEANEKPILLKGSVNKVNKNKELRSFLNEEPFTPTKMKGYANDTNSIANLTNRRFVQADAALQAVQSSAALQAVQSSAALQAVQSSAAQLALPRIPFAKQSFALEWRGNRSSAALPFASLFGQRSVGVKVAPFTSFAWNSTRVILPQHDEPLLPQQEELMAKDLDAIHTCLERLLEGQGFTDDIDNLKNRFIRTSGKLLQQQFELGLFRLNEVIMPLLGNLLPNYSRLTKSKDSTNKNIKGTPFQGTSKELTLQDANLVNRLNKVKSTRVSNNYNKETNSYFNDSSYNDNSNDSSFNDSSSLLRFTQCKALLCKGYRRKPLTLSGYSGAYELWGNRSSATLAPHAFYKLTSSAPHAYSLSDCASMQDKWYFPQRNTIWVAERQIHFNTPRGKGARINQNAWVSSWHINKGMINSCASMRNPFTPTKMKGYVADKFCDLKGNTKYKNWQTKEPQNKNLIYLNLTSALTNLINLTNRRFVLAVGSSAALLALPRIPLTLSGYPKLWGNQSSAALPERNKHSVRGVMLTNNAYTTMSNKRSVRGTTFEGIPKELRRNSEGVGSTSCLLPLPLQSFLLYPLPQRGLRVKRSWRYGVELNCVNESLPDGHSKEVSLIKNAPFRWLRTSKPINSAFREFFGSNPLSQYMDQTNPLAEITHKRRLSSMGPGGIKRETAGMEVRGIHPTHYGRVCPIETPEGKNAGLVNSPTVYGRVGNYGFLETPLYQVIENQVQTKRWTFFSAQHEEKQNSSLATCDTGLLHFNFLAHIPIPVQTANNPLTHFQQIERHRVGYRALSPIQAISIATALIPFLEHDDANRALMGSNMQRQAIPLLSPERPIVGTGFEPLVVMESGQALQATKLGCVSQADANSIIVHTKYSIEKPLPQSGLTAYPERVNPLPLWGLGEEFFLEKKLFVNTIPPANTRVIPSKPLLASRTPEGSPKFSYANLLLTSPWFRTRNSATLFAYPEGVSKSNKLYKSKICLAYQRSVRGSMRVEDPKLICTNNWRSQEGLTQLSGTFAPTFRNPNLTNRRADAALLAVRSSAPLPKSSIYPQLRFTLSGYKRKPITQCEAKGYSKQSFAKGIAEHRSLGVRVAEHGSQVNTTLSEFLTPTKMKGYANLANDARKEFLKGYASSFGVPCKSKICKEEAHTAIDIDTENRIKLTKAEYLPKKSLLLTSLELAPKSYKLKIWLAQRWSKTFSSLMTANSISLQETASPFANNDAVIKNRNNYVNKKHISYSHNTFLLRPLKQDLQFYERSNQETCLNQRPLVQEGDWIQKGDFLADSSASHSGDLALGKNVTVAYMPWEGYNFEDAIVISDRLVSDDIYTSLHIERYEIKVSKNSQGKERITNRVPGSSHSLKHLDNFGIARISSWVQPGDILVGKVVELKRPLSPYERLAWELASRLSPKSPEREKWLNKVWLEDISLRLPPGVCGRVINSQIISSSTEYASMSDMSFGAGAANNPLNKEQTILEKYPQEVHLYLAVKRKIQIGDKLAGRHGNKGIVSAILPQEDMPYLGDGSCIDMVLNPLGVPSRMNLGQIFECLLGLAGSQLGCNFRITPFDEIAGGEASRSLVFLKLYQCRLMYKQQWLFTPTFPGKSKLFDGRTGEPFENWVTVGQAYMLKLIHMVDHKIHARSTGPYSLFTRQPVRGRSRRGGQRLGEMEVWAVEGFGAAYTLQEFLTIKSDDLKARTALQKGFYKQNDVTFGKIHIAPGNPEAFKVLVSELQALCLHIQM